MTEKTAKYLPADIELVHFESTDIVTASSGLLSNDSGNNYDDGGWT